MQQEYLNFRGRARLPVMLQTEAAECGIACLAMIASYFGHRIDLDALRRRHPVSLKGMTLRALIETARHLELACRPLRIELAHLGQLRIDIGQLSPGLSHPHLSSSEIFFLRTRHAIGFLGVVR